MPIASSANISGTRRLFHCYVNPRQPAEAILYRNLHWEMVAFQSLFVLAFGGVGFGILVAGVLGYRKAKVEQALAAEHPGAPWMHGETGPAARSSIRRRRWPRSHWHAQSLWNVISAPLWFLLPHEVIQKGNRVALTGLVFPLVGLGLVAWAIVSIMKWPSTAPRSFGWPRSPA